MKAMWTRLSGASLLVAMVCQASVGRVAAGENIQWHSNLQQAARTSQQTQKPMLIEITAVWCGYCGKMKKTYKNERIAQHVNSCFIPVTVDADQNQRLVQAVGADALPTTVIVSSEFKLLKKITGYHTPDQLDVKLGEICLASHEVEEPPIPQPEVRTSSASRMEIPPVQPAAVSTPQPAFDSHCLVSLLDDQRLKLCEAEHTTIYAGRLLFFASAEYKERFEANPAKYWPALDGACPVSLADNNQLVDGRAIWGAIYRGELWFFANQANRDMFAGKPSAYISKVKR